tara:strand:+ start:67 stop:960 length:894 start_codon:yes stop_codon:yes gene_type:complete
MSSQYPNAFSQKFASDVHIQYQQGASRLKGKVAERNMVGGETMWLPQVGSVSGHQEYTRHSDTQYVDTPHETRKLVANPERWADLIDVPDRNRSVADFMGPYVQIASAYFGRRFDTIVQENALGTNYAKVSGATSETSVAFPSSQQVAVNLGGSSEGLTLAKLIEAKSILGKNETPMGEAKCLIHRQEQLDDLLNNVSQVSDADFANVKALVNGEVNYFMGLEFIPTQTVAVTAGDIASCIAYTKSAIVAGVTSSFNAKVEQLPTKNYSWQVWAEQDIGATRVQEEGVVEVLCDQSP